MANQIGKFVEILADTTKLLWELLGNETERIMDNPLKIAFQTLKKQLSSAPVLIHYNSNKPTILPAMN